MGIGFSRESQRPTVGGVEDTTRTFERTDNTELGYEAVWVPLFAVPAALAWWQGWTIAMWIFGGLTLLAVAAFGSAFVQRDDTKWRTVATFERWPLPLGGPTTITVSLDAIQLGQGVDDDGVVAVAVTLTCLERFEKKAPVNNSDVGHRRGEFESALVVDRTESFNARLVDGHATIEIPLTVPVDRGAPTQKVQAPPMTFEVVWNATIRLPDFDRTIVDDDVPVAAVFLTTGSGNS